MLLEIAIPFTLFLSVAFVVASIVFSFRKRAPKTDMETLNRIKSQQGDN
ncbi:hypothetical protein M3P19_02065 [Muricauda sp. 2012CJ35-5]|uniref:Cbb3-type cytochrome oxidase component FixQ n=1 Tax=Flagellimonas spongiicola TaxID=2942208 RepID=A0ABT0PN04_9FLAO|nr:hypothetical protein [Allomuricauda spongiicola]MCL6272772.1 hypothetical protein [Allomuricauda spongiicola]